MISILSVLNNNKNKNKNKNDKQEVNISIPEYPPCSRCKSRKHFNLECMYKNFNN